MQDKDPDIGRIQAVVTMHRLLTKIMAAADPPPRGRKPGSRNKDKSPKPPMEDQMSLPES